MISVLSEQIEEIVRDESYHVSSTVALNLAAELPVNLSKKDVQSVLEKLVKMSWLEERYALTRPWLDQHLYTEMDVMRFH